MANFITSRRIVGGILAGNWKDVLKNIDPDRFTLSYQGKAIGYSPEIPVSITLQGRQATTFLGTTQTLFTVDKSSSTSIKKVDADNFTTEIQVVKRLRNNGQEIRVKDDIKLHLKFKDGTVIGLVNTFTSTKLADGDPGIIEKEKDDHHFD